MPPRTARLAVLVVLSLAATLAHGQAGAPAAAPETPPAEASTPAAATTRVESPRPPRVMSPMVAEIFSALDEQRGRARTMGAELARTRGSARAIELQRAISALRQETELRLLRIQAAYARREGRLEAAAGLEAAIAALTAPPETREPMPRPAPTRDAGHRP